MPFHPSQTERNDDMKIDANLREALQWEKEHGFRTAAEITLLEQQEEHVPAATVVILQESQEPTADPKEDGPPRFLGPIPFLSTGIDLSQYLQFKSQSPAHRKPAVSVTERGPKTLSEVDLIEARTQLYNAAAGGGRVAKLPADIHARLLHAIVG
jgi:hypothetical protein